jgi:hypothetical protein
MFSDVKDKTLRQNVKRRLLDRQRKQTRVPVTVRKGDVTLTGKLQTSYPGFPGSAASADVTDACNTPSAAMPKVPSNFSPARLTSAAVRAIR